MLYLNEINDRQREAWCRVIDALDEEAQRQTQRMLLLADLSVPEHCLRARRAGSTGRDRASQRARSLQESRLVPCQRSTGRHPFVGSPFGDHTGDQQNPT